jgi:hypothetical protein
MMALLRQCLAELRSKYGDVEDEALLLCREGVALHRSMVSPSQIHRDGARSVEGCQPPVLLRHGTLLLNGGRDA